MTRRFPDLELLAPLGEEDHSCLSEIHEVLARHGALQRFGVTLLHDHFTIEDGEVLLETCDPVTRTLTISPQRVDPAEPGHVVATAWNFADVDVSPGSDPVAALVCRVGCFVDLKDKHKRTHQRVNKP